KNNNRSFVDAICDYFKKQGIENTEKFIKEKLENGKCIVLLDDLDEIPMRHGRFSMARGIENFMRTYNNNKFIITSRILRYEKINIDTISKYYVSSLNDEEIEKFINNWFIVFERKVMEGMPENAIKKIVDDDVQLMSSIKENENINDLARNPFLLSLMCMLQKTGFKLPRYRIELYKTIIETLFETWVMARNINRKSLVDARNYKEGEKIFNSLALWMHENCPGGIEKKGVLNRKIIEIMERRGIEESEARKSVDAFFTYIAQKTELIIQKGRDYYGFRHLSFEEFLAAMALIMEEKYDEYLEKYSKDPRWIEVFLLVVGWLGIVDGREGEVRELLKS
ncbi:MAG: hypothetical protein QMD06_04735, partial [Candidatus Altarchaeum sp.]|nr:hypothetical protein [Candidatus Altarchaeum sp.]